MNASGSVMEQLIDAAVIVVLAIGIWQFRSPRSARIGNLTAAAALLFAFVLVLYRSGIVDADVVVLSLVGGALAGYAVARAVDMIHIPAMVAFQHGAGGVAAFLVSLLELMRGARTLDIVSEISGVLGLTIGALTFSASMVASAKLAGKMRQAPLILPAHPLMMGISLVSLFVVGAASFFIAAELLWGLYWTLILLSVVFGIVFSIRIGGADMPVLISFLNATAGLAASFCGMVIGSQLLIAFGATVAASGSILTLVMCKAMNRNLFRVFFPVSVKANAVPYESVQPFETSAGFISAGASSETPGEKNAIADAIRILKEAETIVIVPGYGMALAKAQMEVAELTDRLIAAGKAVQYAIHPVAGRMPGHMNVLLAEAGVEYDRLVDMETINPAFPEMDLALVIGACDVVNPAAIEAEGTPISGMPILLAHQAKNVVCCNFDTRPGYSGVQNPLYSQDNTIVLSGDAKRTLQEILADVEECTSEESIPEEHDHDHTAEAVRALSTAKNIIIIPGYGMALAKAQSEIVELGSLLERRGAHVSYAIHPVAGRMPGHMNVLLAEADVDYENLMEMDEANILFADTDVAVVVGACDVVNPAAMQQEGTPISGMPILMAHEAKKIIVCNYDKNPGYSGVPNSLYDNSKTVLLLGNAKVTIEALMLSLKSKGD